MGDFMMALMLQRMAMGGGMGGGFSPWSAYADPWDMYGYDQDEPYQRLLLMYSMGMVDGSTLVALLTSGSRRRSLRYGMLGGGMGGLPGLGAMSLLGSGGLGYGGFPYGMGGGLGGRYFPSRLQIGYPGFGF